MASFQTIRTTFAEVTCFGRRSGPCKFCGRPCTRREKFWQTLNPFNRNAEGQPKTRDEIYTEIRAQRDKWEQGEPSHAKCEDEHRNVGVELSSADNDEQLQPHVPESRLIKAGAKP